MGGLRNTVVRVRPHIRQPLLQSVDLVAIARPNPLSVARNMGDRVRMLAMSRSMRRDLRRAPGRLRESERP
jgi:hypothetical protein